MKKINILFVAALTALWSCDASLLDISNPNFAQADQFWSTPDDAQAGINACYSMLYKPASWTQWLSFRYDLTSDEGWSPSPWVELGDWTRFSYSNYNFLEGNRMHWEHLYQSIFRTNQVITRVPSIEMDAGDKTLVMAQAHFMRALWYFQINLLWEKGTLVLTPVDGTYVPEDASEEDIWAQVEDDLRIAIADLPETWPDSDTGRPTKGAATALRAKAYMQQHKWGEAKGDLDWLVGREGTLYDLAEDRLDNFTNSNENNEESVFEIQYDGTNRGGTGDNASMRTSFTRTRFYAPAGLGWADGKARRWIVDEFLKEKRADGDNDTRLYHSVLYKGVMEDFPDENPMYYDVSLANGNYTRNNSSWGDAPEDCYIRKYQTNLWRTREDDFADNNFRLIRYADILLNYAECIIETGGTVADAAIHVDKVRERAGMTKLADSAVPEIAASVASPDAFMKRLQMERALELCFECWRWADLKRWGLLDTQAGVDELAARDADFNNFVVGQHRRMPLPQTEVDNSENKLTQNPNY